MAATHRVVLSWRRSSPRNARVQELLLIVAALAFIFSANPTGILAQTANTGALAGVVTDASGSTIAGAQIRVTSESSGEVRTVTTGASGNYTVPLLPPGSYSVDVTKDGFRSVTVPHAQIVVTETNTLNVHLEVGQVSEKVVVEAQVEQLQTESSALGRLTTGQQVDTLPLVNRNYTQIINLNPGVSSEVNDAGAIGRGGSA